MQMLLASHGEGLVLVSSVSAGTVLLPSHVSIREQQRLNKGHRLYSQAYQQAAAGIPEWPCRPSDLEGWQAAGHSRSTWDLHHQQPHVCYLLGVSSRLMHITQLG